MYTYSSTATVTAQVSTYSTCKYIRVGNFLRRLYQLAVLLVFGDCIILFIYYSGSDIKYKCYSVF
jgi:hypothetical protein